MLSRGGSQNSHSNDCNILSFAELNARSLRIEGILTYLRLPDEGDHILAAKALSSVDGGISTHLGEVFEVAAKLRSFQARAILLEACKDSVLEDLGSITKASTSVLSRHLMAADGVVSQSAAAVLIRALPKFPELLFPLSLVRGGTPPGTSSPICFNQENNSEFFRYLSLTGRASESERISTPSQFLPKAVEGKIEFLRSIQESKYPTDGELQYALRLTYQEPFNAKRVLPEALMTVALLFNRLDTSGQDLLTSTMCMVYGLAAKEFAMGKDYRLGLINGIPQLIRLLSVNIETIDYPKTKVQTL